MICAACILLTQAISEHLKQDSVVGDAKKAIALLQRLIPLKTAID
ncbi:hypothetical protein [Nostoc sp. T09]|nr:hypothetical protein [Nostoc sp. T09]